MNRNGILRMAQEAGWTGVYTTYNEPTGNSDWKMVKESLTVPVTKEQIERFVELVRADEREACAKVCEQMSWPGRSDEALWKGDASDECAKAIRARGEK